MCILIPFQEIYPPKVKEFAYVTDGACTVEDILCQELIIYKVGAATNVLSPCYFNVCVLRQRPWTGV